MAAAAAGAAAAGAAGVRSVEAEAGAAAEPSVPGVSGVEAAPAAGLPGAGFSAATGRRGSDSRRHHASGISAPGLLSAPRRAASVQRRPCYSEPEPWACPETDFGFLPPAAAGLAAAADPGGAAPPCGDGDRGGSALGILCSQQDVALCQHAPAAFTGHGDGGDAPFSARSAAATSVVHASSAGAAA